jgi:hypothetical protein
MQFNELQLCGVWSFVWEGGIQAAGGWDGMQWDDIIFNWFTLLWEGTYGRDIAYGYCYLLLAVVWIGMRML